jgi:hypothetical protein
MSGSITKETGPDFYLGTQFLAYYSQLDDDELTVGNVVHEYLWVRVREQPHKAPDPRVKS